MNLINNMFTFGKVFTWYLLIAYISDVYTTKPVVLNIRY